MNKCYIDEAYQWGIDRVALGLARVVAVFDRAVVNDKGVDMPALGVWLAGWRLRLAQTGRLQSYGMVMAVGAVVVAVVWWWLGV